MRVVNTEAQRLPVAGKLEGVLGCPVLEGNCVETLVNGDRIFPAMLEAIESATFEICFETYIYWSGRIAQRFADALTAASRRGVEVRILLDGWGAHKMSQDLIDQMTGAGAQVHYFNPLRWWNLNRMNYRTHRKILVTDRSAAFTGGVGIADIWLGNARNPEEWHDLHYRLTGPVVSIIHDAFRHVWTEVLEENGITAMEEDEGPQSTFETRPAEARGELDGGTSGDRRVVAQVYCSSPRNGSECVYEGFRIAIESAQDSILLITAYFVPDEDAAATLIAARKRGVEIDIIVPGKHTDTKIVRNASRASWGKLLEAGIRVHVFEPTMVHAKMMAIDDQWVVIGSANFDNRSFSLNDEINVNVYDEAFAEEHREIFEYDLTRCHQMTFEEWKRRGLKARIRERLANLVRNHI